MRANAARESGVSGASAAPVTIASASPCWIIRRAVPIAWLPAAQADTTLKTGPRSPWRNDSAAEPALLIMSGMASGDTESRTAVAQDVMVVLERADPADDGVPSFSWKPRCTAESAPLAPSCSTVSTRLPATLEASVRQDSIGLSSTSTVQAPHSPPSQPVFVPVSPTPLAQVVEQQPVVRHRVDALSAR